MQLKSIYILVVWYEEKIKDLLRYESVIINFDFSFILNFSFINLKERKKNYIYLKKVILFEHNNLKMPIHIQWSQIQISVDFNYISTESI